MNKMKCTITYRVYGADGHEQKESFRKSYTYNFSNEADGTRIIEVRNYGKTKTHDYSEVVITRNTKGECADEISGQITDGIFENVNVGRVEIVSVEDETADAMSKKPSKVKALINEYNGGKWGRDGQYIAIIKPKYHNNGDYARNLFEVVEVVEVIKQGYRYTKRGNCEHIVDVLEIIEW